MIYHHQNMSSPEGSPRYSCKTGCKCISCRV